MNEDPISQCEICGGEVRRVIHPVGIVFKGSGFYATDSRSASSASKPAETGGDSDKATAGKADAKNQPKGDAKKESSSGTAGASSPKD